MSEEETEQIDEEQEDEGVHLLDYLIVLAKHKKLILKITLPVAIITFILTLFNNYFYQAQTSIFPSQKQETSIASQLMGQFGIIPGPRDVNIHNNQKLFVEIIKSRTFTDRLMDRFKIKKSDKARKLLLKKISIIPDFTDKKGFKLNESPLMRISVKNQNPQRAADMANAIVEELNVSINNIAISTVSQRRLFLENQLKQSSDALIESEEAIKSFQEQTGILEVGKQTSMVIEKIAELQAQITAKEIELQVMKSYSTASNPDFQRVEETIKALKKELANTDTNKDDSKNLLIPTSSIPALGLQYQRIFRDFKFNETLHQIIVKQYEAAKLDEAKDGTLIQVIDKAVPPEKQGKVRILGRGKALAMTLLAFFFACTLAFAVEFHERSSANSDYREKLAALRKHLFFKKNK